MSKIRLISSILSRYRFCFLFCLYTLIMMLFKMYNDALYDAQ
jgi:hypothetical protein